MGLMQGGMEIPCILILKGKEQIGNKAKKLLQFCQQKSTVIKTEPNICNFRQKSTKENEGGREPWP